MHGTFRVHWAGTAALLGGWTLLGTAWQAPGGGPAIPPAQLAAPAQPQRAWQEPVVTPPQTAVVEKAAPRLDRFIPVVRIELPVIAGTSTAPPVTGPPIPLAPEAAAPVVVALRPVDIAQIVESDAPSPQIAQVDAEAAPDDSAFAEKAQIAQLSVPLAVERELALLQEDAPSEVAVRLGDRTLGKVAVRVSQINTIDVQLSGLLDMMADRFAPEEFARLRGSVAADSYVPLDQLRAAGLGLRYDPVYDELVVSA